MAKEKKLKAALERYKGVDHKLEKQKKLQKEAEKRKRQRKESDIDVSTAKKAILDQQPSPNTLVSRQLREEQLAADAAERLNELDGEGAGWETDKSEDAEDEEDGGVDIERLDDESDSDEDSIVLNEDEDGLNANGGAEEAEDDEDEEEAEDIPLSDIESLASEDKGDVIPHQRLTINNTAALQRSLKSFALPSNLPFSATQSVTSAEPVEIKDVEDDLNRELSFYKQSLDAVKEARALLKKEGVPFSRPRDYFAEMVKSEEQMGKVRQKVVDEAARKKASQDAKRQRDLKKFGKAVQVAKMQERDKAKRDTLEKINVLKRSKLRHPLYRHAICANDLSRTSRGRHERHRRRHVRCRARRRRRDGQERQGCKAWRSKWSWAE